MGGEDEAVRLMAEDSERDLSLRRTGVSEVRESMVDGQDQLTDDSEFDVEIGSSAVLPPPYAVY